MSRQSKSYSFQAHESGRSTKQTLQKAPYRASTQVFEGLSRGRDLEPTTVIQNPLSGQNRRSNPRISRLFPRMLQPLLPPRLFPPRMMMTRRASRHGHNFPEQTVCLVINPGGKEQLAGTGSHHGVAEIQGPKAVVRDRLTFLVI